MNITVYTTNGCPACVWTKRTLAARGITYTEINLAEHPEYAAVLKERGHATLPVIVTPHDEWSGARPDKLHQLARTQSH